MTNSKKIIKKRATSFFSFILVAATCYFTFPSGVQANNGETSFKKLAREPVKYKKVDIEGTVLRRVNANTYLIQDGTGVLKVSIPSNLLPKNGLFPKNHVSFEGEVEVNWNNDIEIEVEALTFSF